MSPVPDLHHVVLMSASDTDAEAKGGIGAILLGVGIMLGVMVVGTILLVPRIVLSRLRRPPARPDGYGETPLATPPDAATVARRARLLALQLRRLGDPVPMHVITNAGGPLDDARRAEHEARRAAQERDIATALADDAVAAEATPDEVRFLRKDARAFSRRDVLDVSWRAESLAVLLWAQRRLDALPPFDEQMDPEKLLELGRTPLEGTPALRAPEELATMQSRAKLWHWRSRTRQLEEEGTPLPEQLPVKSYEEIVRITVEAAQEEGSLDAVRDGDFKAMGKSFRYLSADEWSSVQSIIMERHRALNWLCGYAPDNRWDDVPTHT